MAKAKTERKEVAKEPRSQEERVDEFNSALSDAVNQSILGMAVDCRKLKSLFTKAHPALTDVADRFDGLENCSAIQLAECLKKLDADITQKLRGK